MLLPNYCPFLYQTNNIVLRKIVINRNYEDNFITIFGAIYNDFDEKLYDVDFGCEISLFTDLLLAIKKDADRIISFMVDELMSQKSGNRDIPCLFDIENVFGAPYKIENATILYYRPMEENEDGELEIVKDEFYFIDSFSLHEE